MNCSTEKWEALKHKLKKLNKCKTSHPSREAVPPAHLPQCSLGKGENERTSASHTHQCDGNMASALNNTNYTRLYVT